MNRPLARSFALALALALALPSGARGGDDFPAPRDTEPDKSPTMPADQAAAAFRVPEGFRVSVFASEPDVRNPIAMAWDARGRLWVAENYTYAERETRFDLRQRDRVLIFEDSDNDGRFDRRTVFLDDVQVLTSIEVGRGGVYLLCPPRLLFVPDADGDDRPDSAPRALLDGFDVPAENYHNFANGLRWGPDDWLYGRCGASAPGSLGKPGTSKDERIPVTGGLWRFRPGDGRVEVLNHGTTNPWGHDWDPLGEPFFINTVNGHLWHAIPGAHFVRPHTIDPNPRVYQPIDQHADHWHWDTAKTWDDSRKPTAEHDRRGGGHAHSGMIIYQGDQWPAADRGKLFTLNFHGRRTNVESLERAGSGFVGRHEADRFFAGDPKFRGIDMGTGPDGGVFVLDWNDSGECHENNGVLRSSGRIYKITHGDPKEPTVGDLARLDAKALAALIRHPNAWFERMARRQLADRAARGEAVEEAVGPLRATLADDGDPVQKLRALWALHAIGRADAALVRPLLGADHEAVRAWAIRLLTDNLPIDTVLSRRPAPDSPLADDLLVELVRMAESDPSGLVRLTLASTLQRLPVRQRAGLAGGLLGHSEDSGDHNLPLMVWYGLIPLADADPSAVARLGSAAGLSTTRRLIARRLAEDLGRDPGPIGELLDRAASQGDRGLRTDILVGLAEGVRGWRKAAKPPAWDRFASTFAEGGDRPSLDRVRDLNVLFGDGRALDELRRLALDDKGDLEVRRSALLALIEARPDDLRATCERLLKVRFLNATAARGLALFDDPGIGSALVASYRAFHPSERPAVIGLLSARARFARVMLDKVADGTIPRGDISAFHARQVRSLGDADLSRRLAEVWGEQRESAGDRREAIARAKARLTPDTLVKADLGRGRALFNKACASCHQLYGQGGDIGPDLTGSGRSNLDYLLENILDPSATVTADFRMAVVSLHDGRVLNGLLRNPTERPVTLRTQQEAVVLDRRDVEAIAPSPQSLMPEGLLEALGPDEARDLIAYLIHPTQVALPKE